MSDHCERCAKNPVVPGNMICRECVIAARPQSLLKSLADLGQAQHRLAIDLMREANARIEEQIDNDSSPPISERRVKLRERKPS